MVNAEPHDAEGDLGLAAGDGGGAEAVAGDAAEYFDPSQPDAIAAALEPGDVAVSMLPGDWLWMGTLCLTGATGHYLLIKCYEVAEASAVQPFAYFQLVFASAIGILLFGETVEANLVLGAAIIVSAGLFALWRAHVVAKRGR